MGNLENDGALMRAQFQKAKVQVARIEFFTLVGAAIAAKTGEYIEWEDNDTLETFEAKLGHAAMSMGMDFDTMFWEVTKALSMLESDWNKDANSAVGRIMGEN